MHVLPSLALSALAMSLAWTIAPPAAAYPFITKSPYLRHHKLKVRVVNSADDRVLMAMPFGPRDEALATLPMVLLGDDGRLHRLHPEESRKARYLADNCGTRVEAMALVPDEKLQTSGRLVVVGMDSEAGSVRWLPAGPATQVKVPRCPALRPGLGLISFRTYAPLVEGRQVFFAEWGGSLREGDMRCSPTTIEAVGLMGLDGERCEPLNHLERDCDGTILERGGTSARGLIGILMLGEGTESWLIFESVDHESSGLSAIPLILGRPDRSMIEEVHDSGC